MKSLLIVTIMLSFSAAHAWGKKKPISMCQSVAEDAATAAMDAMNGEGLTDDNDKPRALSEEEKASVSEVDFLDASGEVSDTETGIYGVVMGVMEECMDGSIVSTKKSVAADGKESCEVIEIKSYGDRDCG